MTVTLRRSLSTVFREIGYTRRQAVTASPVSVSKLCDGDQAKSWDTMPGPRRWPLLGSVPDLLWRNGAWKHDKMLRDYFESYGPVVRIHTLGPEVVVYDPNIFLEVFRREGNRPRGTGADAWPFVKYMKERDYKIVASLLKQGDEWWDTRSKLNPDMFNPQAVASYLPLINQASAVASEHIQEAATKEPIYQFMNRAAFDLFAAFALGSFPRTVDRSNADPRDLLLVNDAANAFEMLGSLLRKPPGMANAEYKRYAAAMDSAFLRTGEIARAKLREIGKCKMKDSLAEELQEDDSQLLELDSLAAAGETDDGRCFLERLHARGHYSDVELEQVMMNFLSASIDTTANTMNWVLVHLAQHPEKQDVLHAELSSVLSGGGFVKEALPKLPYLKACLREAHRLTPVAHIMMRRLAEPMEIGGYEVPAGVNIMMNLEVAQKHPEIVEHPEEYVPERWLSDAVKARKGTAREIMDNKLIAKPFSFGPRMCLGARVADVELLSFVARIVQDWRFVLDPTTQKYEAKAYLLTRATPFPNFRFESRKN